MNKYFFFSKHAPNVNISVFKKIYETSISFCKCIEKSFVFFKQQFMVCFFLSKLGVLL